MIRRPHRSTRTATLFPYTTRVRSTGKTVLANEIAKAANAPLNEWNIKSTTKAQQGLYEYDAVARLRDGQLGDERVHDIANYIRKGKLWEAFIAPAPLAPLLDEPARADTEFSIGLTQQHNRTDFHLYETSQTARADGRPLDTRHTRL